MSAIAKINELPAENSKEKLIEKCKELSIQLKDAQNSIWKSEMNFFEKLFVAGLFKQISKVFNLVQLEPLGEKDESKAYLAAFIICKSQDVI